MFFILYLFFLPKIVKGERRGKRKTCFSIWALPNRILAYLKIVKGESNNKPKACFWVKLLPSRILKKSVTIQMFASKQLYGHAQQDPPAKVPERPQSTPLNPGEESKESISIFRLEGLIRTIIKENSYFSDFRNRLFDIFNLLFDNRLRGNKGLLQPIFLAKIAREWRRIRDF